MMLYFIVDIVYELVVVVSCACVEGRVYPAYEGESGTCYAFGTEGRGDVLSGAERVAM